MKIPPLFEHQKQSVAFMTRKDLVFDMSSPGTGKTRAMLESIAKRQANGAGCALVLAPKSLLKSAWEADCAKYTPWLRVSCAFAENREQAFAKKADIYVTNHDAVKWLVKQPKAFWKKFQKGIFIIDESGAYKHHTSQRSKAVSKIKHYFPVRMLANGTPAANTILELWHQVFILDDGKRLGKSYMAFRNAVCEPEQVGPRAEMVKWHDKPEAYNAVTSLLSDITVRHVFEECVDIPENHAYTVDFELSPKHYKRYFEMQEHSVVEAEDTAITAVNAAAVVTKLLQIASGAVYDGMGNYVVLDRSRYELVIDLAEERRHSLVFFLWQHQRDELIAECEARKLTYALLDGSVSAKQREETVQLYQNGFYRVLLAQPQSAAHGLTLTRGTATIWASPTYNLEHFLQGNRRIYRAGQKQKTETITVIAKDTLEERVYQACMDKSVNLVSLLETVKEVA